MSHLQVGRLRLSKVIDPALVRVEMDQAGTEFLVFPVKVMTEKVLACINCMPGGEFLPAAEIRKVVGRWDGMPITIDHPRNEAGELEFANRDDVFLAGVKVGEVTNPQWRDGFLWVDARLNRTKAAATLEGRGIIQALLSGSSDVEVSAGYAADLRWVEDGKFNGDRYNFEQYGIDPDHVALLPIGLTGACSVEDGCGAARAAQARVVAAAAGIDPEKVEDNAGAITALFNAFRNALGSILGSGASANGGDDPPPATDPPSGEHSPAGDDGGTPGSTQEGSVDRNKVILALVAASVPFTREQLDGMDDEGLTFLAKSAKVDCGCGDKPPSASAEGGGGTTAPPVADPPAATPPATPPASDDGKTVTISAEEHASILARLEAIEQAGKAAEEEEREELVTALCANKRVAFSKEDLQGFDLKVLRGIKKTTEAVDYSGLGGPRSHGVTMDEDDGYMPVPDMFAAASAEA